jgi:hypothetical protein
MTLSTPGPFIIIIVREDETTTARAHTVTRARGAFVLNL